MDEKNNWWAEVEAILEKKSLLKHPFYQAWTMGQLSREDLAHYARQYYQQESRFPRFVSAVHSNCPDLKVRQALLENLKDEETGPENHPELWLRFAEAAGASRESVAVSEMNAGTKRCVAAYEALTKDSAWTSGLAALYAYEAQQPAVSRTKIEGLRGCYGLGTQAALGFFQAHEKTDAWHSEAEKQILLDEAGRRPELKDEIKSAVSVACDALNGLLDGVCEARGIRAAMPSMN